MRRRELAALERDIARTRARLDEKLASLGGSAGTANHNHSVQEVAMERVHDMSHKVADTSKEAGSSLVELVRHHPLPAALIGAGLALLVAGGGVGVRERHRDDDESYTSYGSRYGYGEGDYTGYVQSVQSSEARETSAGYPNTDYAPRRYGGRREFESYGAYDSGYDTGHGEAASGAGRESWSPEPSEALNDWRQTEGRAASSSSADGRGLGGFVEDQPLIAGLITLAFGALLGLLFPSTKREDELMGSARDHLAEQAKGAAERAREAAQRTFEEVRETAKEEFSKLSSEAQEDGEELLAKGKEAAKKVADEAKDTAKDATKDTSKDATKDTAKAESRGKSASTKSASS